MRRIDRIHEAIKKWPDGPFVYGETDCWCFVSHVYMRVDKQDYMTVRYRGQREAELLISLFGTLSNAVSYALARHSVPAEHLREGDLALYTSRGGEGVGIVLSGGDVATVRPTDGKVHSVGKHVVAHGWRMDAV